MRGHDNGAPPPSSEGRHATADDEPRRLLLRSLTDVRARPTVDTEPRERFLDVLLRVLAAWSC